MQRVDLRSLGNSHGFRVVASDGDLGEVETPVFPPGWHEPYYLVVVKRRRGRGAKRAMLPVSLVRGVDLEGRIVSVDGALHELRGLPESLPLTAAGSPGP